MKTVIGDVRI